MRVGNPFFAVGVVAAALMSAPMAETSGAAGADPEFARRFAKLTETQSGPIAVTMKSTDSPLPPPAGAASGIVNVTATRSGFYTPTLITAEDVRTVVNQHMRDVRACYLRQLKKDPEWAGDLILDLAIKRTGRVTAVAVAPGRVQRSEIGQCLMRTVPKWTFPAFTGETDEGITQEVVNASFPFSFSTN